MDYTLFAFYLCSLGVIVLTLNATLNPNPVHGALGLALGLVLLGMIYVLMGHELFAAIQILVYAGAIMVLFLFMIMVLHIKRESGGGILRLSVNHLLAAVVAISFFLKLYLATRFMVDEKPPVTDGVHTATNQVEALGSLLFDKYALPFELISVVLLIGVMGAVILAKKNYIPAKKK